MCKFTKIQKMLEDYSVSNYFVQFGEMEIHTTKFYFYMVKVNNGILVKIRQNDMMTYFVDMVVKNQEQAKSIILGYILESQKFDMEQLKEEMNTPKNDMEKLEFQKMEWFDTMQEEETIVPCGTLENEEGQNMNLLTNVLKYANKKEMEIKNLDMGNYWNEEYAYVELINHDLKVEVIIERVGGTYKVGCWDYGANRPCKDLGGKRNVKTQKELISIIESVFDELQEISNVPCETLENEEEEEYITFMNNEGEKTKALIVSRKNKNLLSRCNHDLIETNDGKYWELWTTYNGYLVAIDTDEYNQ